MAARLLVRAAGACDAEAIARVQRETWRTAWISSALTVWPICG